MVYRFMVVPPRGFLKSVCEMMLMLVFSLLLILSCSSNPNNNEFDNTNDDAGEVVSEAPTINTSEEFVLSYNAYSNKDLTGVNAIVADTNSFLWDTYWKCRAVQAYLHDATGGNEYRPGAVINVDESLSFKYDYQGYFPGINIKCESYKYTFDGYPAELANQTIRVWGTANYWEEAYEEPVEGTSNEFNIVELSLFKCDLIIKINDDIFSLQSNNLDTTTDTCLATINGIDYQINSGA